ncbi:hypothetical protein ACA910_007636 [Epithemia clementina (nom. ined.)]
MPPIKIRIDGIGTVKLATQHGYDKLLKNEGVKFLLDKDDQAQVLDFESLVDGGAYTLGRTQEQPQQQHPQQQSEDKNLQEIRKRLDHLEEGGLNSPEQEKNQPQPQERLDPFAKHRYRLYYHHGQWSRVPEDWRFPRVTVPEVWRQWWIGDPEKGIPPLQLVGREDVQWLAKVPLSKEELKGRTGRFHDRRRNPRKTLMDLRFLMETMVGLVRDKGKYVDPNVATADDVDAMFNAICDDEDGFFYRYDEDDCKNEDGTIDELKKLRKRCSKKWVTIVHELRRKRATDTRPEEEAQGLENNKQKRLKHDSST